MKASWRHNVNEIFIDLINIYCIHSSHITWFRTKKIIN